MRKKIFDIVEGLARKYGKISFYYVFMVVMIVVSIFPLAFKEETGEFVIMERVAVGAFVLDYILRLITADYKLNKGVKSFFVYPFTFLAIIDLVCILPVFATMFENLILLRFLRFFRYFRIFRLAKMVRYSKSIQIINDVISEQKSSLLAVCVMAASYILISALIVFDVEPDTFNTFFDAIYWATVSLTTVGYGDIYPVSVAGRIVAMLSSLFGIAIIALPAGIITAGYMEKLREKQSKSDVRNDVGKEDGKDVRKEVDKEKESKKENE